MSIMKHVVSLKPVSIECEEPFDEQESYETTEVRRGPDGKDAVVPITATRVVRKTRVVTKEVLQMVGEDVEMSPEEEAEFLASQA